MNKYHPSSSSGVVAPVNAIRHGKGKKRKANAQPGWKGKPALESPVVGQRERSIVTFHLP
ncbi:hypothetical protein OROHE_005603 [Orobanche hederae]